MKKTYPLTAAQNMHYQWIKVYKTQQVSGLSIVAAFQADIDIPLLKRSIELEKERYSCLRLRFTKPDENGEIQQGNKGFLSTTPAVLRQGKLRWFASIANRHNNVYGGDRLGGA